MFGNATMAAVSGATDMSNAVESVVQQRDGMKDAIYSWGSILYSNPVRSLPSRATTETGGAAAAVIVLAGGSGGETTPPPSASGGETKL